MRKLSQAGGDVDVVRTHSNVTAGKERGDLGLPCRQLLKEVGRRLPPATITEVFGDAGG